MEMENEQEIVETVENSEVVAEEEEQFTLTQEELLAGYAPPVREEPTQAPLTLQEIEALLDRKLTSQERQDYLDSDDELVSKSELQAMLLAKEQEIQQRQMAEREIAGHLQASAQVQMQYKAKVESFLAKQGIDINADPQLSSIANELMNSLVLQKGIALDRIMRGPRGEVQAIVLTAPEMAEVVEQHSKQLFGGLIPLAKKLKPSLSPAVDAVKSQSSDGIRPSGAYQSFSQKRAEGKAGLSDAVRALREISSQKK
jgi:hypothetical protein